MIYATSLSVVDSLTASEKAAGVIFPDIERIRDVSAIVAVIILSIASNSLGIREVGSGAGESMMLRVKRAIFVIVRLNSG